VWEEEILKHIELITTAAIINAFNRSYMLFYSGVVGLVTLRGGGWVGEKDLHHCRY
jgi:hypothetical protein